MNNVKLLIAGSAFLPCQRKPLIEYQLTLR
ncbi:Uncharacterised protein [Escherichia coli]|nr:Uncharacterised protein [Escherichia coli]